MDNIPGESKAIKVLMMNIGFLQEETELCCWLH
jgi:hypothetical protein